jgi:hypothetical protein
MKKTGVIGIVWLAFIMFSCGSFTGTVWDDSIPLEQCARVWFHNFEPTSYNRIIVNSRDFRIATIPAGIAEFSGNVAWSSTQGNVRYFFNSKDAVFSCKLEEGKDYWAFAGYKSSDDKKHRIWGIYLYDDEIKARIGFPGEDKLVGFIPFDPPVVSD